MTDGARASWVLRHGSSSSCIAFSPDDVKLAVFPWVLMAIVSRATSSLRMATLGHPADPLCYVADSAAAAAGEFN